MSDPAFSDETLDDCAGGKLKILQKTKGYRFSLDALLLAHFVTLRPDEAVLELGTGSGIVSLILASRWNPSFITGIDIQDSMVTMAERNVALNGLSEKIKIRLGDVRNIATLFPSRSFDTVVANPPYRKAASGRVNPLEEKALARHEIEGTVGDFLQAAGHVLRPGGRAFVIFPAARMVELLWSMREAAIEPKRLRIVHSHEKGPGKFLLVEGLKGGGEELDIMSPLVIYEATGDYTDEMKSLFSELSAPGSCGR